MNLQHSGSAVRFTDFAFAGIPNPPMNRWAIVIRRLRRLLRQSRVRLIDVDDAALKRDSYGVGAIVRAKF